ncbi:MULTISPECIES: YeeE/YedE family protein [Dyella]|uniref:YeeE/YedE family protein n=2 Tax=Dyella TaxID=231454 RepID=A0A4R0YIW8_9GAMM|nr:MULTISPECIES: YeeE/YedE family protein [Dyella]TBR36036.1 YeeE/YedE family protein [Dyella terrae]TCI06085.1 YeeE/YedE family protein [Dyella soli]
MSMWLAGLAGGALIGLSAVLLLWLNGRIAGISGIAFGISDTAASERVWRIAFVAGLLIAGGLALHLLPHEAPREGYSRGVLVLAGLLVGVGTAMGSGCTSGHGVCGLARFSRRSLAAVLTFMITAFVTVFVARHLLGVI